jgi:hypothetical protein
MVFNNKEYKRFKLTKAQHNELFPARRMKWSDSYLYYKTHDEIIVMRITNIIGRVAVTVAFPFLLLLNGLANTKEMWGELKDIWNPIRRKSYTTDNCWHTSDTFKKVMVAIGEA